MACSGVLEMAVKNENDGWDDELDWDEFAASEPVNVQLLQSVAQTTDSFFALPLGTQTIQPEPIEASEKAAATHFETDQEDEMSSVEWSDEHDDTEVEIPAPDELHLPVLVDLAPISHHPLPAPALVQPVSAPSLAITAHIQPDFGSAPTLSDALPTPTLWASAVCEDAAPSIGQPLQLLHASTGLHTATFPTDIHSEAQVLSCAVLEDQFDSHTPAHLAAATAQVDGGLPPRSANFICSTSDEDFSPAAQTSSTGPVSFAAGSRSTSLTSRPSAIPHPPLLARVGSIATDPWADINHDLDLMLPACSTRSARSSMSGSQLGLPPAPISSASASHKRPQTTAHAASSSSLLNSAANSLKAPPRPQVPGPTQRSESLQVTSPGLQQHPPSASLSPVACLNNAPECLPILSSAVSASAVVPTDQESLHTSSAVSAAAVAVADGEEENDPWSSSDSDVDILTPSGTDKPGSLLFRLPCAQLQKLGWDLVPQFTSSTIHTSL